MLINLLRIDEVLVNNLNTNIACTYCIHEVTINLMTIENVIDIKNDDKKNSKRETNYTIGITKVQLSVFVLQTRTSFTIFFAVVLFYCFWRNFFSLSL